MCPSGENSKEWQFQKGQTAWNKKVPRDDGMLWCARGEHWCPLEAFEEGRYSWCKECQKSYYVQQRPKYRAKKNAASLLAYHRLRAQILAHYGVNGVPMCHCCGITTLEFLGLDHIAGGGCKHRRAIKTSLYDWIRKNNFPPGFRDLCHNCNQALGAYGRCPHQLQQ